MNLSSMIMKVFIMKLKNIPNMNKRIYLMILVLLLVMPGVMAQTVQIHEDIEVPGSIQVQVDTSPPTIPGNLQDAGVYTSLTNQLYYTWSASTDP